MQNAGITLPKKLSRFIYWKALCMLKIIS